MFLEVAWSLADSRSLLFDASCQDLPGPFLHADETARPDTRFRIRWEDSRQSANVAMHVMRRWREEAGIDAVVWTETGCTLFAGKACREGFGARDVAGEQFLRQLAGNAGMPVIADLNSPRVSGMFPAVYDDSL